MKTRGKVICWIVVTAALCTWPICLFLDQARVKKFDAHNATFTSAFSPEQIIKNIKTAGWSVATYEFGAHCRCGFVIYAEDGSVRIHLLEEGIPEGPSSVPHLGYPTIPSWVIKKRAEMGVSPDRWLTLLVIYDGNKEVLEGFDGNAENQNNIPFVRDTSPEKEDVTALRYMRDQWASLSWYRTPLW